jgi:Arm DNA-binding domain
MKQRLTKRTADAIAPGPEGILVWDSDEAAFGLKVTPAGRRIFVFQNSMACRDRHVTIGRLGVDDARTEAKHLRGLVARGHDPASDRARVRSLADAGRLRRALPC